jgi:two-component system, NtrC family, response regulator HydG
LSDRKEDIPLIVQSFILRNNEESGKNILGLAPEALEKLMAYSWPGNVRELRNAVEYAFVLCSGRHIHVEHLPPKIISPDFVYTDNLPLIQQKTTDRAQHELIRALRQAGGNQSKAASILGSAGLRSGNG